MSTAALPETAPPPPRSRTGRTSPELSTSLPDCASADFSCAGVQAGWRWSRRAAAPATCGEAMLVPLKDDQVPSRAGTDERISTPGALTSGFSRSDTGVGPADENSASSGRLSGVTAATVSVPDIPAMAGLLASLADLRATGRE